MEERDGAYREICERSVNMVESECVGAGEQEMYSACACDEVFMFCTLFERTGSNTPRLHRDTNKYKQGHWPAMSIYENLCPFLHRTVIVCDGENFKLFSIANNYRSMKK